MCFQPIVWWLPMMRALCLEVLTKVSSYINENISLNDHKNAKCFTITQSVIDAIAIFF